MQLPDLITAQNTEKIIEELERRVNAESAREDVPTGFLPWLNFFFPHWFEKAPNKMHLWFAGELEEALTKRNIQINNVSPRESAKSTLGTFGYPIYSICHGLEKYMILVADTFDQSKKHVDALEDELENNEKLAYYYPSICGKGPVWAKDEMVTRNNIRVEAIGSRMSIRGRKKGNIRPTAIIVDDPDPEESGWSPTIRERVHERYFKGVAKAGRAGVTNKIICGTMIHNKCLVGVLNSKPGYRKGFFRAIEKWPLRMDLWAEWEDIVCEISNPKCEEVARKFYEDRKEEMDDGAEVLWPENEDLYALMMLRATEGHTSFEAEKQNNPRDPSKCEWDQSCFEGDIWFDDWPQDGIAKVCALDPSKGKEDSQNDYQAMISAMLGRDGCIYVDADIGRYGIDGMVSRYVDHIGMFEPDSAVVENDFFQQLFVGQIEGTALRKKIIAPIVGQSTDGINKIIRIRRLSPFIARKKFRFKRRSRGVSLLIDQLKNFPTGDFDDGPDALEMALRRLKLMVKRATSGNSKNPF